MNAELRVDPARPSNEPAANKPTRKLTARLEPFDSYWQAPKEAEAAFDAFTAYYRANYLPHLPVDRNTRILVISCGPGYLLKTLTDQGYRSVCGIDSDPAKIAIALRHKLPCHVDHAFEFLSEHPGGFDVIVPEQELNHLTHAETIEFLQLCRAALRPGGRVFVYAMNGANPLVGSENLSHNIDHFYNVTEYSLEQLLKLGGFDKIRVLPLKLYVFWTNPLNYVGLAFTTLLEFAMRAVFALYGKKVRILSKKIAAIGFRS
jgi:2-polyprenyl-3-methyl-5-hydroxy-6-metoxy-1,4-benzoquinol methylase